VWFALQATDEGEGDTSSAGLVGCLPKQQQQEQHRQSLLKVASSSSRSRIFGCVAAALSTAAEVVWQDGKRMWPLG